VIAPVDRERRTGLVRRVAERGLVKWSRRHRVRLAPPLLWETCGDQGEQGTSGELVAGRRAYIVRAAGTATRPGKVWKIYPYTLQALQDAIGDARFRSRDEGPQQLVKVEGSRRTVIKRFERGREVPAAGGPAS
jgi:hypothetical protein